MIIVCLYVDIYISLLVLYLFIVRLIDYGCNWFGLVWRSYTNVNVASFKQKCRVC